jgi:DNA modification methylase
LYFGDCLDVLRDLKENYSQPFIDLIYIDPPFNSKHNYNVLFESMDMKDANVQKQAFADTWTSVAYMDELHMLAEMHKDLYEVLTTFGKAKSISHSAVEYLTTTALQILYMHKLLKDTGSFKGEKISDTWVDIPQMATKEFLGYPTQKPEALMERIIGQAAMKVMLWLISFVAAGLPLPLHKNYIANGLVQIFLIWQYA